LHTLAHRMHTRDISTRPQREDLAHASTNAQGGQAIRKKASPISNRWNGHLRQAQLSKDKTRREKLEAFRSDVFSYRNAWQFLSQIVDYQDPSLHQREILASMLARTLPNRPH